MRFFSADWLKILTLVFIAFSVVLAWPLLSPGFAVHVKAPSASYDCDDATLDMYTQLKAKDIEATLVIGNLDENNETFDECDHIWLLVRSGSKEIAYDWGLPRFDKQHYEGYVVSLDYLLEAVAADIDGSSLTTVAQR